MTSDYFWWRVGRDGIKKIRSKMTTRTATDAPTPKIAFAGTDCRPIILLRTGREAKWPRGLTGCKQKEMFRKLSGLLDNIDSPNPCRLEHCRDFQIESL